MTPTRESILADLRTDLTRYETDKPRAQQVETGGSQLYGCIAESIFRLRGTPADELLSWDAFVGTAVHEALATVRPKVRDGVITEQRFVYRNVPFSVDCILEDQALLIDYKTDKDADDIVDLISTGPPEKWIGQVQGGAAAAREAGIQINYVAVIVLPRSGDLDGATVFGPWEFDQQAANEAAAWSADVDLLAIDNDVDPRDHRGKPAFWCYAYCPFARTCRGERTGDTIDLAELAVPAEAYAIARDTRDESIDRMRQLRPVLFGMKGRAGRVTITTTSGSVHDEAVEDIDAYRDLWRFIHGDDAAPPTVTVEKKTSGSLRVKWVKGEKP